MDWKPFFDALGMNGTRWQWRMMRLERNLTNLWHGRREYGDPGFSLPRLLIVVNVILFAWMVLRGMGAGMGLSPLFNPDFYLMIYAGAQYWPLVLAEGEWWRCLTYAFTHGGLIHLGFNMMVLYQVGPLLEHEIGRAPFLILYTLTALTATLAGYLWHPMVTVVGASGSLFGLIGFSVAYFHRLGDPLSIQRRDFMFKWAIFAFVFGLIVGADNAGHLGGAVGGALLGLLTPLTLSARRRAGPLVTLLAGLCAAALVGSLGILLFTWVRGA